MQHSKKIAFIKFKDFSHTNESLLKELKDNFPDYQIDVIDLFRDLISKRDPLPVLFGFWHYGRDIILGRQTIIDVYFRTPYIFRKIRRAVLRKLANQHYAFTVQTQSLFDASIPGIPHFLYTDHTHLANLTYPGYDRRKQLSQRWVQYEKEIYHHATMNFTMSSNISRSMVDDYSCSPDKVTCIYCGANVKGAKDGIFDPERFMKKNILFVGIDWQRKGGPTLAEAFKKVLNTHPDATLTIVGCSPSLHLPNCHVIGRVPLQEVSTYFEQASVFCMPTTIEPFGIVYLEAMAHRLPVIGTNLGAIPDFIHPGENGFLVEPNNIDQLVHRLNDLLNSPDKCKAFGEFGHSLFWRQYTWENTGVLMRNAINQIIN